MPQHKKPKALRALCIDHIVNIISRMKQLGMRNASYDSALQIFGLFPVDILEDIIKAYESTYKRGIDSFFPVEVLINCRTTRLSLHFSEFVQTTSDFDYDESTSDSDYVETTSDAEVLLQKIGSVGSSIISLKLSGAILREADYFVQFAVSHLTNVKQLTLLCSKLDDSILAAVGRCCRFLEEVTLTAQGITDAGLVQLVPEVSPLLKRIKIEYDFYQMPNITTLSVVHLLRNSPNLEAMRAPHLREALEIVFDQFPHNAVPLKLSVCDLYEQLRPQKLISPYLSHCLTQMCPEIAELSVEARDANALLPLISLRHLRSLSVTAHATAYSDYLPVFPCGVSYVLKHSGHNITTLQFNIREIDLTVIDSYCPMLSQLEWINVCSVSKALVPKREPFKNLRTLKIFAADENCLTSYDFYYLLHSCVNLQTLCISNCDNFSDQTLLKVFVTNPLNKVAFVELTDIPAISMNSLNTLTVEYNSLKQLSNVGCNLVSERDTKTASSLLFCGGGTAV